MGLTRANAEKKMNKSKRALTVAGIASIFAATVLCWLLLELISIISIDDAMYAGWTQHGFKYFFERNVWHYQNFNGRFFIHLVMQLVLFFEEHLYAIIFPFFISISTFIFATLAKKDWDITKRLFASALVLLIYISLGRTVVTATAMWVAGGFNYIFPLLLVSSFYILFLKQRKKSISMLYLIPFAILCGATTEQYGMYTIGLIVMTYAFDIIDNKKFDFRSLGYLGAAISSLMTILLAPPTMSRISNTKRSLLDGILYNWSFLGGNRSEVVFPILFMLFIGVLALFKAKKEVDGNTVKYRRYSPLLICGIPFAGISALFTLFNNYVVSAVLTFIYVILMSVTMLCKKETRELGKLVVCGFGTFFMMSITTMAASRTCVPCILSLTIVLVIMFIDTISKINKKALGCALAIAATVTLLSFYGFSFAKYHQEGIYSKEVYEQLKSASETGVIKSNWDETLAVKKNNYRNKTLTDVYPLTYYQEKYDIPDNVKYIITSEKYEVYNLSCDGYYSQAPAIKHTDGNVYVPLLFPHLKESITTEFIVKKHPNKQGEFAAISANGKYLFCAEDEILQIGPIYFVRLDYVLEQWEYDCTFDAEENTYIFTSKITEE